MPSSVRSSCSVTHGRQTDSARLLFGTSRGHPAIVPVRGRYVGRQQRECRRRPVLRRGAAGGVQADPSSRSWRDGVGLARGANIFASQRGAQAAPSRTDGGRNVRHSVSDRGEGGGGTESPEHRTGVRDRGIGRAALHRAGVRAGTNAEGLSAKEGGGRPQSGPASDATGRCRIASGR